MSASGCSGEGVSRGLPRGRSRPPDPGDFDPVALQAQGITASQVNAQLRQTNLNAPEAAPRSRFEQSVRVLGNARDAFDFADADRGAGGRTAGSAIGESRTPIRSSAPSPRNGRQVITFNVQRSKGSSRSTTYDAAWEAAKIERKPADRFREIFNAVDYTKAQYDPRWRAVVERFSRSSSLPVPARFRATVISAFAIPLSAIFGLWFMSMLGINLNFM